MSSKNSSKADLNILSTKSESKAKFSSSSTSFKIDSKSNLTTTIIPEEGPAINNNNNNNTTSSNVNHVFKQQISIALTDSILLVPTTVVPSENVTKIYAFKDVIGT